MLTLLELICCVFQASDVEAAAEEAKQIQNKLQSKVQHYKDVLADTVSWQSLCLSYIHRLHLT